MDLTFLADGLSLLALGATMQIPERRVLRDRRTEDVLQQSDEHSLHHAFIRELVLERSERRLFREKLKTSVVGWLIIGLIGGCGTMVYRGVRYTMEFVR